MNHRPPRRVSVLGSTGSVGVNTVDLITHHNERTPGTFEVVALTAKANVAELALQARRLRPKFVAVAEPSAYSQLKAALEGGRFSVAAGEIRDDVAVVQVVLEVRGLQFDGDAHRQPQSPRLGDDEGAGQRATSRS